MICPKCNESQAHRSHRSGLKDRLYRMFEMIPYRCHACNARFYAYRAGETSPKLRTREEQKIMELRRRLKWKRSKRELAVYGIAAILFLAFLYMELQQRVPAGE